MTLARPIDCKRRTLSIPSRHCHIIHLELPKDALSVHSQSVGSRLDPRDRDFATGADIVPVLSDRCDQSLLILLISLVDRPYEPLTMINGILEVYPNRR